jgi:hypothetical protein
MENKYKMAFLYDKYGNVVLAYNELDGLYMDDTGHVMGGYVPSNPQYDDDGNVLWPRYTPACPNYDREDSTKFPKYARVSHEENYCNTMNSSCTPTYGRNF